MTQNTTDKLLVGKIEALFNSMHDLLIVFNEQGRILMVNPYVEKTLGVPFELLLTKQIHDLRPPLLRVKSKENLASICRGETTRFDLPFITDDKTELQVEGKVGETVWGRDKIFFGVFRDVTEKKKARRFAKQVAKRDRLMAWLSNRLVNAVGPNAHAEISTTIKTIGRFFHAERAFFVDFDHENDSFQSIFEYCANGILPKKDVFLGKLGSELPWVGFQVDQNKTIILPTMKGLPDEVAPGERHLLEQVGSSIILVPVQIKNIMTGLIGLCGLEIDIDDPLLKKDVRMLRIIGEIIRNTLDNDYHRLALEESEKRLSLSLDAAERAVWELDWEAQTISFSPLHREILGYSEDQWRSVQTVTVDQWKSRVHPSDHERVLKMITEYATGQISQYEVEYRVMNEFGGWVWLESSAGRIENQENQAILVGSHKDITRQKRNFIQLHSPKRSKIETDVFCGIVGQSLPMQQVFEAISQAATSDASVIVYGESGTGKELVANAIHTLSDRANDPLVTVNCGAISPGLIESEFFGHRKGAFTGATADKAGYLESAHNATLFLDELGELPLNMQVKLLRALDGGGYTPVGGTDVKHSNARIISATNRNLREMVKAGTMREDFFYRIHIIPIYLPPLRERKEDIVALIDYFIDQFNNGSDKNMTVPDNVYEAMANYRWPGNVRELQNTVFRYMTLGKIDFLDAGSTEIDSNLAVELTTRPARSATIDFKTATADFERGLIVQTLRQCNGNKSEAARILNIPRRSLHRKIDSYQIEMHTDAV